MQYPVSRRAGYAPGIPVCLADTPANAAPPWDAQVLRSSCRGLMWMGCLPFSAEEGLLAAGSASMSMTDRAGSPRWLAAWPAGTSRGRGGGIPPVGSWSSTGMHRLPGLSSKAAISRMGALYLSLWESLFFFVCVIVICGLYGLVAYFLFLGRWAELCLHGRSFSSASGAFRRRDRRSLRYGYRHLCREGNLRMYPRRSAWLFALAGVVLLFLATLKSGGLASGLPIWLEPAGLTCLGIAIVAWCFPGQPPTVP